MTRPLTRSLTTRGVVVAAAVIVGLAVGVVRLSVAFASDSDRPSAPAGQPTTHWPKNAEGLTYGSGMDATSPQDEPDLILASATNGKIGYVLRADLEGPEPKTPQEALSRQAAQAGKDQVIPVYQSDGTTRIGVFVIAGGGGDPTLAPSN